MTAEVATGSLAEAQLELLWRMAALDPAPCLIGGYAEDALLAGTVTRPHVDIDWIVPRHELPLRLAQARKLGFGELETWGESAPGEPFYLYAENGELKLELAVQSLTSRTSASGSGSTSSPSTSTAARRRRATSSYCRATPSSTRRSRSTESWCARPRRSRCTSSESALPHRGRSASSRRSSENRRDG